MRKREISADDNALFKDAMKDAKPLAKRERVMHTPKVAIPFRPPWRAPQAPVFADIPMGPIGGHVEARARRGQANVEARIDLHGFTHGGAYRALIRFLMEAQLDGKRLVLVITGKGGVLRNQLPVWLGQADLKPLVGGMSEAHASHGGAGAFYVSLRKLRPR